VTSEINFISINENFPVPGQDNDTQVFRDNFDTIKRSLRTANEEISNLQDISAKLTEDNDFEKKQLRNFVLGKASIQLQNYNNNSAITNNNQEINFFLGLHHVLRIGSNINLQFVGFPGDPNISVADLLPGMGKITLELYSNDSTPRNVTFNQPNGAIVKTSNFPSFPLVIQSPSDPVLLEIYRYNSGVIFIRYLGQFV
jgi:hypothetical protein